MPFGSSKVRDGLCTDSWARVDDGDHESAPPAWICIARYGDLIMPLSYKIVLGSVALLCLVVIGFKAVSSGETPTPPPMAASTSTLEVKGDGVATNVTGVTDNSPSRGATSVDSSPDASTTDGSVTGEDNSNEVLADVTRELTANVSTNTSPESDSNVTLADQEDQVSATTEIASASGTSDDSSGDAKDSGLDDLLSRIRKYESEVLGEPENANDTTTSTNTDAGDAAVATTDATTEDTTVAVNVESISESDATATDTGFEKTEPGLATVEDKATSLEVVIPAKPPVLTIGQAAPIVITGNENSNEADNAIVSKTDDSIKNISTLKFDDTAEASTSVAVTADVKTNDDTVDVSSPNPITAIVVTPTPTPDTVAVKPVAPAVTPSGMYRVKPGDTFSSISVTVFGAERHWFAIAEANPKVDSRRMRVGQLIRLPNLNATKVDKPESKPVVATVATVDKQVHTVRAGETLWAIARQHYGKGEHWHHLYKTNRDVIGSKPGNVRAGMKLRLASLPPQRP